MPFISADSHVVEPGDLWTTALGTGPDVPHIREVDGNHFWYFNDTLLCSFSGIQTGTRFEDQSELRLVARESDVRPGGYDPRAHLADNEGDGVVASVMFPTTALMLYGPPDRDALNRICGAYNDWMAAFCAVDPARIKGMAMLNVDDPREAATELTRAHGLGLAGALIPVYPGDGRGYDEEGFEPLWEQAEQLQMPLAMHIASDRRPFEVQKARPSALINADHWVRTSLTEIIFGAVFVRHPDLYVLSVEHEIGWVPYFLEQMDYNYTQRPMRPGWNQLADGRLPSDYFRSNVRCTFTEDRIGIAARDTIGLESLMWGSDYPHTESTFPRSRELVADMLAGLTEEEVSALTAGNVQALFSMAPA